MVRKWRYFHARRPGSGWCLYPPCVSTLFQLKCTNLILKSENQCYDILQSALLAWNVDQRRWQASVQNIITSRTIDSSPVSVAVYQWNAPRPVSFFFTPSVPFCWHSWMATHSNGWKVLEGNRQNIPANFQSCKYRFFKPRAEPAVISVNVTVEATQIGSIVLAALSLISQRREENYRDEIFTMLK